MNYNIVGKVGVVVKQTLLSDFFQCDHISDMINNLTSRRAPDCFWACFGV